MNLRPVAAILAAFGPAASAQSGQWSLGSPTGRIGADGSAPLTIIRQVVALGDDSVFVVDDKDPAVLLFESRGRLVRRIGRRGGGPGEFRYLKRVGLLGDTLWADDTQGRRTQLFATSGRFLTTRQLPASTVLIAARTSVTIVPAGRLVGGGLIAYFPTPFGVRPLAGVPPAPPHGTSGTLAIVDTTLRITTPLTVLAQASVAFTMHVRAAIHFPGPNYFATTPLWRVAPDGSGVVVVERAVPALSTPPRYRVSRWNARGVRVFSVDIPYEPVRVPARVVDSIIAAFAADVREGGGTFDIPRVLRDSLRAPATYPPVSDVIVATDGSTWVAREERLFDPAHRLRYDVVDVTGRLRGTLSLARPGRIAVATARIVWVVETDDDDVPVLVRYPIVRP